MGLLCRDVARLVDYAYPVIPSIRAAFVGRPVGLFSGSLLQVSFVGLFYRSYL